MKRKENLREGRESDLWYLKNEGINLRVSEYRTTEARTVTNGSKSIALFALLEDLQYCEHMWKKNLNLNTLLLKYL